MKTVLVLVFGVLGAVGAQEAVPWSCNLCPVGACRDDTRCPVFDNPNDPTMIRHTNCNQFYVCSHGQACEMTCPPGLHWSQALKRCEWPNVACCDPSVPCLPGCPEVCPPPPVTTPIPVPVTTTTMAPITTTAAPGTTLPDTPCLPCLTCIPDVRCPATENPDTPTHLPHESDCGQFYKCAHGQRCPMRCRDGEHFSVQLQRCDWPHFACCSPTVPCQPLPDNPPVLPPPSPTVCRPDAGCPAGDDLLNPILLPVPGNCGAFYKCSNQNACLINCPVGQHYSQALRRCERPDIACCDSTVTCCAVCVQTRLQELGEVFGLTHLH